MTILTPSLGYVILYSLLPHKEWRFVMYVVPALTVVASMGAQIITLRRSKSLVFKLLHIALILSIIASALLSATLLGVSSYNYPGGVALTRLSLMTVSTSQPLAVYADNLATQTGITRFLTPPHLMVDKTENATTLLDPSFWEQFDYVLAEHPERVIGAWTIVDVIPAWAGIKVVKPHMRISDSESGGEEGGVEALDAQIAWLRRWNALGEYCRRFTGGWWVTARIEGRIKILKRDERTWSAEIDGEDNGIQDVS